MKTLIVQLVENVVLLDLLCVTVTCGGAAVLRVLSEGHGSLHSILLHLLDGLLRQRLNVPETDVELVRSWTERPDRQSATGNQVN